MLSPIHVKTTLSPAKYCVARVLNSGSSFYLSFYALPKPRRRAMMALYAFCREVDDLADEATTPEEIEHARSSLNLWHQALTHINNREKLSDNPIAHHPIMQELAWASTTYDLPRNDLQRVVEGMLDDLDFQPFANWSSLEEYCDKVAGVVGRLSTRIFGFHPTHEAQMMDYATALGLALQLINILRDIDEDKARGRVYIPTLYDGQALQGGRVSKALFIDFDTRIHAAYRKAHQLLPPTEKYSQRASIIMGRIYWQMYQRIKSHYQSTGVIVASVRLSGLKKLLSALASIILGRGLLDDE